MTTLDLSGDNRLPALLDERAILKANVKAATERLAVIDDEIREKLGDAEWATLPGWQIEYGKRHQSGYTVAARNYRALFVRPAPLTARALLKQLKAENSKK